MDFYNDPLQSYLDSGEKLLWSGQPKQGLRLQASDVFMIPFSLLWGGFAIFWEVMALGIGFSQGHPQHPEKFGWFAWIFPLWGVPFVLVGLYMIFGRFFYDAMMRSKTRYGVTDRRAIVLKSLFGSNVTSLDYGTMTNLNLVERGDRSGDVLFGSPGQFSAFSNTSWPGSNRYVVPGFYQLPEARNVYNQIRNAQQQMRR